MLTCGLAQCLVHHVRYIVYLNTASANRMNICCEYILSSIYCILFLQIGSAIFSTTANT